MAQATSPCPTSGTPGRAVPGKTVHSLVRDLPQDATNDRPWFYCGDANCPTVYFDDNGHEIDKSALTVRVGEKEPDPPHTVCYCFGHTREDIEADIDRSGKTSIPAAIKAKIQAGACRCDVMNPKGTCCLGDVAREVKQALRAAIEHPGGSVRTMRECGPRGGPG